MTNQELFEVIQSKHKEKKIVSLCKKLIKKCSFNSSVDIENLCSLAYWLFIYGYVDEVISVCEMTHNVEFPGKGKWNVWDFIMFMWGLEVYIYKQQNNIEKANVIIQQMDSLWMFPPTFPPENIENEIARRDRFTFSVCSYENKITSASSKVDADGWRFIALFYLIGYGSTGLFLNLDKEKDSVDGLVEEYIQKLKMIK